jgi:hypothetical protein
MGLVQKLHLPGPAAQTAVHSSDSRLEDTALMPIYVSKNSPGKQFAKGDYPSARGRLTDGLKTGIVQATPRLPFLDEDNT